jgi:very-short-patch-repair endonuclease
LDDAALILEPSAADPILNPRWQGAVRQRLRGWKSGAIEEVLFPPGEPSGFEDVVRRLGHAMAASVQSPLRPGHPGDSLLLPADGLQNLLALFLPGEARFTQGAERDLETMRGWSDEVLDQTALRSLLRPSHPTGTADCSIASPSILTEHQFEAATAALQGPLTVIQGPPGTGKTEVILGLLSSALLSGKQALVVSKNHQALDEIERRLEALMGRPTLLTRARDSEGERDTNLVTEWRLLCAGEAQTADGAKARNSAAQALEKARHLQAAHTAQRQRTALHLELSRLSEHLHAEEAPRTASQRQGSLLARLLAALAWWRSKRQQSSSSIPPDAARTAVRRQLEALGEPLPAETQHEMADAVARGVQDALRSMPAAILPLQAEREALQDTLRAFLFSGRSRPAQMTAAEAQSVLRHRPIWAVSALSAASRLPMIPALFDLVIFDEASQCDIASALPLAGRARRAVVVGDPEQLGFIPQLSLHQEHALMDAAGLRLEGRHRVAQSQVSLFSFAAARPGVRRHFLADQFRSAPAIVAYLNEEFYGHRLQAAQDERRARWPNGFKPGLSWHNVKGRTTREEGGNVNHAEAEAIVGLVKAMLGENGFDGTIGVLSPFNAQVALLKRRFQAALGESAAASLRISTIDRFQGGEADVVLFSVVVGVGAAEGALAFYQRERRRLNVAVSRARALCLVVGDRDFASACRVPVLSRLAAAADRTAAPRDGFDSKWERLLDAALRQRGLNPIPQYPVGNRSLDLAIDPEGAKLDIEVDGRRWHTDADGNRKIADRLRDRELMARGWSVRRFWVHELAENMEKCVDLVERDLGRR